MVFSSIVFLFFYLPAVLLIYHLIFLPVTLGMNQMLFRRLSNLFLLMVSLFFYFWGENFLLWIVIASTMIDYICGMLISGGFKKGEIKPLETNRKVTWLQRLGLVMSITSNLAFLGFFKYFNFGVDNFNSALSMIGLENSLWLDAPQIILPLGISFYTFQSMSYTIDVFTGRVKATRNLVDFACYVTMFPQLVAGPIVRYRDVAEQLVSRRVSIPLFASGVVRFVIGLGKKVLIANTVAVAADQIFALPAGELTLAVTWLGIVAYALQIYFDFSGYSDMAIGLGRMFGFRYLENFNFPYIALSIQDFWRRWHISLSSWFRDYVYIPLGGSRKGNLRTYFNLVTVFFLCGLWHGASWSFVVWGLYHGAFLVAERLGFGAWTRRLSLPLRHVYTLLVVLIGWVFFRADTLSYALSYIRSMAGFGEGSGLVHNLSSFATPDLVIALVAGIIGSAPIVAATNMRIDAACSKMAERKQRWVDLAFVEPTKVLLLSVIMLLSVMSLASGTYNPFIYFRF